MRITGGTLAGRTVRVPPGVIRPAMDRMRESYFSILGPLDGTSFLDLFSGSGIIALEAISRGARPVTLVERDRGKRRVIAENLEIAPFAPRVVIAPVEAFIARERFAYDVVFLDPPFDYRHKADLLGRIARGPLLAPNARMLIHYPDSDTLPDTVGAVTVEDERAYGRSTLRIYRRTADSAAQDES
ncbi:MAG: 16S rRNA (guanine(966)-N(2))-methyltransferase RsmD [Spirochaetaceae bacterium]|nr:MAG: 16S rRNA (guanine(966)-N(2))-methyltransferase RsmD [Spirochaetaceae bacterium]